MKSDVVWTRFALCLHPLCTMFAPCLYYVLMSFDVKIGKINHRGTEAQRRSQKTDFRFEKTEGKRADHLVARTLGEGGGQGRKEGELESGGEEIKK